MQKVISLESANTEEEVLDIFSKELDFPDYFGRNSSAFWDAMTDLNWLDDETLSVEIHGLPELAKRIDPNFVVLLVAQLGEICRYWDQIDIAKDLPAQKLHKVTFSIYYSDQGFTKIGGNIWGESGAGWSGPKIWKDSSSL